MCGGVSVGGTLVNQKIHTPCLGRQIFSMQEFGPVLPCVMILQGSEPGFVCQCEILIFLRIIFLHSKYYFRATQLKILDLLIHCSSKLRGLVLNFPFYIKSYSICKSSKFVAVKFKEGCTVNSYRSFKLFVNLYILNIVLPLQITVKSPESKN